VKRKKKRNTRGKKEVRRKGRGRRKEVEKGSWM